MLERTHTKHVYLIGDNTTEIALTRRVIASAGFPVHLEVIPGVTALKRLFCENNNFTHPDLFLVDSGLPMDESFKLIEWIRQNPVLLLTPIVVVGRLTSDADVVRCYECGVSSYINKSVDTTEYSVQLKEVCSYWLDLNVIPVTQLSKSA